MHIDHKYYIAYKLFNSIFLGLSIGTVMSIYAPLKPSIYSVGGIALALGMMALARLYNTILTIKWFYRFSMLMEIIMFGVVLFFLISNFSYQTALFVYIGYQVTFIFGSYLVRAETLFLSETDMLTSIDTYKQIGSLVGMGAAYIFYKLLPNQSNMEQVYAMHYLLLIVQIIVIFSVWKSFQGHKY
ncbi:MAG: hypothetical protein PHE73_04475 [Sulfurovaceae bacterium]|nr:hypothetical protein [Sulfurovaceae bacterium]